jgi:predicted nucleic acid-binding protein
MMIVADAGPLRYLVAIGAVEVLETLYTRVLVPEAVAGELDDQKTPAPASAPGSRSLRPGVRFIRTRPPTRRSRTWTQASAPPSRSLSRWTLMDEWDGRAEAKRRHLHVTGTLGVLADGHLAGLVDFETALAQLRATNFYISDEVVASLRQRLFKAAKKS